MTNYKIFRIISKYKSTSLSSPWIRFILDDCVNYESCSENEIDCEDYYPFNTYSEGDYLEIDLEITKHYGSKYTFSGKNVVRKVSSSAVVPSSSGGLTIYTNPSSAAEVAGTVTQTVLDHADRTGGIPQIEIGTDKTSIRYYPPKK